MGYKINKGEKKKRDIVIFTDEEKAIRSNLSKKLTERLELPSTVYSYTKGKSVKQAVEDVMVNVDRYKYFIKIDVEDYFKSININKLLEIISRVDDDNLISEIKQVLESDIKKYGDIGLPLGSPLSNQLSNYYLIDIDEYFNNKAIKYYRFCDDILMLYDDNFNPDEIYTKLKELGLSVNYNKIVMGSYGDSFTYLGREILKSPLKGKQSIKTSFSREGTLEKFKSCKDNVEMIKDLKEEVIRELPKEYAYLFRYYFYNEDKEELIEELLDNNSYREAYLFEGLANDINTEFSIFESYSKRFLKEDTGYLCLDNEGEYTEFNDIINEEVLKKHLGGEITLAKKLDYDGKSDVLVFDIDNIKKLTKAEEQAINIKDELSRRGYLSYIEFSGMKGYHVWVFFDKYIKIEALNNLGKEILKGVNLTQEEVEIIPRANNITEGQRIIKLPLGIHPRSGKKSSFNDIYSLEELYDNSYIDRGSKLEAFNKRMALEFEDANDIYSGCSIVKNIVKYGILKGEMNHFSRVILTYIYPFVPRGKEFIHEIIQEMDNYSFSITEKHVDKAPENPISCKKLKEYFKDNSKCICNECELDKRGGYKNPVLHCKNSKIIEDSINKQANEILGEVITLNEERKKIQQKLSTLERKLNSIYEDMGRESIKVSTGNLKKSDGKWIIEIEV